MAKNVSKGGKALVARIEKAASLAFFGADLARIAEKMEVSYDTARDWKKFEVWDATLDRLRETQRQAATNKIDVLTIRAIEGLESSLQSENESIRLRAAIWFLERGKPTIQDKSDALLNNGSCCESFDFQNWQDDPPEVMIARFRRARSFVFQFIYRRDPVDDDDLYGGLKALQATLEKAPAPNWGK